MLNNDSTQSKPEQEISGFTFDDICLHETTHVLQAYMKNHSPKFNVKVLTVLIQKLTVNSSID